MAQNTIISSLEAEVDKLTKELEQIEATRKERKARLKQHRKALTALTGSARKKKEAS